jgi:hypothetical protein
MIGKSTRYALEQNKRGSELKSPRTMKQTSMTFTCVPAYLPNPPMHICRKLEALLVVELLKTSEEPKSTFLGLSSKKYLCIVEACEHKSNAKSEPVSMRFLLPE